MSVWAVLCLIVIITCNSDEVHGMGHHGKKKSSIIRPCELTDWDCIRTYFVKNFDCTYRNGPVSDPLIGSYVEVPIPHANITYIASKNCEIGGLSEGEIIEFFINETSGNLVLAFNFERITHKDPSSTLRFHLKGKEPIDLVDIIQKVLKQVSMTLVFPYKNGLEISANTVYTYIGDSNVSNIHVGPGLLSTDPVLRAALRKAIKQIQITEMEEFVTIGPILLSAFFENNICKLNN